jgi:hypothetical protein
VVEWHEFPWAGKVAPYELGIYFVHTLVLWVITKLNIPDLMEFALTLPLSAILVIRLPANCPKAVRYWA